MDSSRFRSTRLGSLIRRFGGPGPVTIRFRFGGRSPSTRSRFRRGPDARSARPFVTDALPFEDPPLPPNVDVELERRHRRRRGTVLAGLLALFVIGSLTAILGPRGVRDVRRAVRERDELKESLEARRESVLALRREVQRLQEDPRATERIARESLGFVKKGEITFILPGDPPVAGVGRRNGARAGSPGPVPGHGPG